MFKTKSKADKLTYWFTIGLIAQLIVAPNATVIKVIVDGMDPLMFNVLRSGMLVLLTFPFILFALKKFSRHNFVYTIAGGLCMAIATITLIYAIKYSQASYVVVLALASPIILVLLTRWFMRERINFRAAAGVTLAALGAFLAVSLPLVLHGNTSLEFYPLATGLIAIHCVFFPLGMIYFRKANEAGLPLPAVQSSASIVILLISLIGLYAFGQPSSLGDISAMSWLGIAYSSIIVVFLARMMIVASYERIGSGQTASLTYVESIVAVIIPVLVLGEQLSLAVVAGGILILLGVYLTEKHQSRRHFHLHRHR